MKKLHPTNDTKAKKLICDWTDKKNFSIDYRMLKLYVRDGMVVEKLHEIISFKQGNWLEKYMKFDT